MFARSAILLLRSISAIGVLCWTCEVPAEDQLWGGFGKVDITQYEAGPVSDPLHVRAMVLQKGTERYAVLSLDVVAVERIGPLPKDFLRDLRAQLQKGCGISPEHVLLSTTHCHGISAPDVLQRTVAAVEMAIASLEPIEIGVGRAKEDRISQNRRVRLKDGKEADYRHAYSLPSDDEIESAGPIDPDVTILKVRNLKGEAKGILYHFACHPIQGTPSGGNTADITGYASATIEQHAGAGSVAVFLQGCGGDINPVGYKNYDQPRDAERLGNLLALTVLKAAQAIETVPNAKLSWMHRKLAMPLADLGPTIAAIQSHRDRLVEALQGTTLNFKDFQILAFAHQLAPDFPSADKGTYLQQQMLEREGFRKLDRDNRQQLDAYLSNVRTMEAITRLQTNLRLLKMHEKEIIDMGSRTIEIEMLGLELGDLRLLTFPGELTVQIGLNIKQQFPSIPLAVCGYTNGYIYYAPTAEQLANRGYAQEDSDCLLASHWQQIYEAAMLEWLRLSR